MKRKILSVFFALVLVLSFSLVTAVPVAAVGESTFTVTGGTYTTLQISDENGDIAANLTGTWDSAVIGDFTATGTGGLYVVMEEPRWGTTATISVGGILFVDAITFVGTAVRTAGDPISNDEVTNIAGSIIIQTDGTFVADLTGTVFAGTDNELPITIDISGSMQVKGYVFSGDSIQDAITAAEPGDTINVAAGIYSEPQLSINKNLTILGAGQDDVTIQRSDGSSYFLSVSGDINFTMKNLTIDASGSDTTNFVAHISDLTSATFENVTVIGQGKDHTTDGGDYYYTSPGETNVVGGLDLIDVNRATLINVTVSNVSRNGFSFTNVNTISLKGFTASNCGHSDSTGWAGLALYRDDGGASTLILQRDAINSISNAPIGVNAHIISGTVRLSVYGDDKLNISDVLVPVVAPNTSNSDTFALKVIPSAAYKVYATDGPSSGFASYFFTNGDAIAAALDAFILFDFEHVVYDLATPKFIVGAGMKIQSAIDAASDGDTISVAAGMYNEEVKIMDKSLTLLGAQADVPIVDGERAGDESVISGTLTSWPYNIYCVVRIQNSGVVVNGFTIVNAKQWNIGIQGSSIRREGISNILVSYNYIEESGKDGIFRDNAAADVTIDHNYIASNSRGIATNGGATTITDNTFYHNGQGIAFWGGDPYSLYFSDYEEPKYPTIISGNSFTDDSTSMYLRLDKCHQSITITGNDIAEARNDAIRTWNTYDVDIVNPAIHFNNIVGSTNFGINNTVEEIILDATLNWWGDISGPTFEGTAGEEYIGGTGDKLSANVDYAPWLTRESGIVVADNIAYIGFPMVDLKTGWNIVSTPVALDPGETVGGVTYPSADTFDKLETLGDGIKAVEGSPVYRFAAELSPQRYVAFGGSEVIQPCEAYYVKMESPDILPILFSPRTSAPTKDLYAGWNLVGLAWLPTEDPAYGLPVDQALKSVEKVTLDLTGYAQVVSPPVNQYSWIYTGVATQIHTPNWDTYEDLGGWMLPTKGYWVFMVNDGTLAGFTFTPMSLQ